MPGSILDGARPNARRGCVLHDKRTVIAARYKADFLAFRLVGGCKSERSCQRPHLSLAQATQRKQGPRHFSLAEREQEVRLVFRFVAGAQQMEAAAFITFDPGIVAGSHKLSFECGRAL